jgi:hypothetical protein
MFHDQESSLPSQLFSALVNPDATRWPVISGAVTQAVTMPAHTLSNESSNQNGRTLPCATIHGTHA